MSSLLAENISEEIAESFPNLGRETDPDSGGTEIPHKFNPRSTPRHVIKMAKEIVTNNCKGCHR